MTLTCTCWRCAGKAHNDGTLHVDRWSHAYAADPLTVADDEPWRWTCPACGCGLARDEIESHGHPERVVAWFLAAIVTWGVIALLLWLLWRE